MLLFFVGLVGFFGVSFCPVNVVLLLKSCGKAQGLGASGCAPLIAGFIIRGDHGIVGMLEKAFRPPRFAV